MFHRSFILLFAVITISVQAQETAPLDFSSIDKRALQMPETQTRSTKGIASFIEHEFDSDLERVRALFTWIVHSIDYDVANMHTINNFEKRSEKIARVLKTRKGICEQYALVFNDVCRQIGIRSYVIGGYTKQYRSLNPLPHAWCVAELNGDWYFFDPTWAAGYLDKGKFHRKLNDLYFMAPASYIIITHMPFDYLWQLQMQPITNAQFMAGRVYQDEARDPFSYRDSLKVHDGLPYLEQREAALVRMKKNGTEYPLVKDRIKHLEREILILKQNISIDLYNAAVVDFNDGINKLNAFIEFRNNRFLPAKNDIYIQHMLSQSEKSFKACELKLNDILDPLKDLSPLISHVRSSHAEALDQWSVQQEWLTLYFSMQEEERESMFYIYTITEKVAQ